jgi:hypothetical protein
VQKSRERADQPDSKFIQRKQKSGVASRSPGYFGHDFHRFHNIMDGFDLMVQ